MQTATPRDALLAAAACLQEAAAPRWTVALELPEGAPARVAAALGSGIPEEALVSRAQALATPGPTQQLGKKELASFITEN